MAAVRRRSDVLRARKKATRKKATRRKKPTVADPATTTQLQAFVLLQERLNTLYAKADKRAGVANQAISDLLEGLEKKLLKAVGPVIDQLVDDMEDLAVDIDARVEDLQNRAFMEDPDPS